MVTSRIWFTAAQKAELWERWKNGQSAAASGAGYRKSVIRAQDETISCFASDEFSEVWREQDSFSRVSRRECWP